MLMVGFMKVNFIEDESKSLVVEFEGMDRSVVELVKAKLLEDKEVDFVGVNKEHPEIGTPRLIVKSGKSARSLVAKAIDEVQDELKELSSQVPKK